MTIETVGDSLLIVRDFNGPAWSLADWLELQNIPGIIETIPSYNTVGVLIDPLNPPILASSLTKYVPTDEVRNPKNNLISIRICFELGEDLSESCQELDLSRDEFIQKFTQTTFDCFAVGFQPGFPYLGWLPKQLQGLERKPNPRVRVPAGSVAITGKQAGIYPKESPGGWHLVGRTPEKLVDLETKSTLLKPGNQVQFIPITERQFKELSQ